MTKPIASNQTQGLARVGSFTKYSKTTKTTAYKGEHATLYHMALDLTTKASIHLQKLSQRLKPLEVRLQALVNIRPADVNAAEAFYFAMLICFLIMFKISITPA